MFCPECGKQVDDGLAFCPECGAQMDGGAAPQYAAYDAAPQYGAPAYDAAPAAPAKKAVKLPGNLSPKMLGIIGGAVAAVILLIVIIVVATGKGYEKTAKKYVEAEINNDIKTMYELQIRDQEKYNEALYAWNDENNEFFDYDDIGEMYADWADDEDVTSYDEYLQHQIDEADDEKLDELKIVNLEVKKSTKLSDSKLEKITDAMTDALGNIDAEDLIDAKKIKTGYKVSVKYEYTYENEDGKEKTVKDTEEIIVVKYKGNWVVVG